MGKLGDKVLDFLRKVADTDNRYSEIQEEKHNELMELQTELAEKDTQLKELHKMYLLKDVSAETYDKAKAEYDVIAEKVKQKQLDIGYIQKYQLEDSAEMIKQIEAIKGEYAKEQQAELEAIQLEVLQAKKEYLNVLTKAREKYQKAVTPHIKYVNAKNHIFGENKSAYIGDSFQTLGMISVGEGYVTAKIEQPETFEALAYGNISPLIDEAIDMRKKKK